MDNTIKIDCLFGYCRTETRFVPRDGKLYGQGRRLDYDREGNLTRAGDWSDTGAVLFLPAGDERPTAWQRIKRLVAGG